MEIPKPEVVEANLFSLAQAVSRIDQRQFDFQREILGNGSPGRLIRLEDEFKEHKEKLDQMSKKYWVFTGFIVAASHGLRAALVKFGLM